MTKEMSSRKDTGQHYPSDEHNAGHIRVVKVAVVTTAVNHSSFQEVV